MLTPPKIFSLLSLIILSEKLAHGQNINGYNGYTTFYPGNINILISAPHGGTLKPFQTPESVNKPSGGEGTRELAFNVGYELNSFFHTVGKPYGKPFVVLNNLDR